MWKIWDHSKLSARRVLGEALMLFLLTLLLASLSWIVRRPVPLRADLSVYEFELKFPLISAEDARQRYEAGDALFVDVRDLELAAVAHIPGAFSIRLASFEADLAAVLDFIYPEDELILYGDGDLQSLAAVADRFMDRGYEKLSILSAGIDAWEKAGGELSEGGDD